MTAMRRLLEFIPAEFLDHDLVRREWDDIPKVYDKVSGTKLARALHAEESNDVDVSFVTFTEEEWMEIPELVRVFDAVTLERLDDPPEWSKGAELRCLFRLDITAEDRERLVQRRNDHLRRVSELRKDLQKEEAHATNAYITLMVTE